MDRNKRLRSFCIYLYVFAALVALMAGFKMYRSSQDMFPQRDLPSLGTTADTVVRVLQRQARDERFEAALELLLCACVIAGAAERLSKATRVPEAGPRG